MGGFALGFGFKGWMKKLEVLELGLYFFILWVMIWDAGCGIPIYSTLVWLGRKRAGHMISAVENLCACFSSATVILPLAKMDIGIVYGNFIIACIFLLMNGGLGVHVLFC